MLSLLPQDPEGSGKESWGGSAPRTYVPIATALFGEKIASYGKKLKRGREGRRKEERKERNTACIPAHLDPLLGVQKMNQKNLLALKDSKSGGGNQSRNRQQQHSQW